MARRETGTGLMLERSFTRDNSAVDSAEAAKANEYPRVSPLISSRETPTG